MIWTISRFKKTYWLPPSVCYYTSFKVSLWVLHFNKEATRIWQSVEAIDSERQKDTLDHSRI